MALELQTANIGSNFTGLAGAGYVELSSNILDDTQRAEILSASVQSGESQTSIIIRLASSLANANGAGPFIELANVANATGVNFLCRFVVPRGWHLYALSSGGVTTDKYLEVDWHKVTLEPRA